MNDIIEELTPQNDGEAKTLVIGLAIVAVVFVLTLRLFA